MSSYGGNAGTLSFGFPGTPASKDGVFHKNSKVSFKMITDGTSSTLLLGERSHYDPVYDQLTEQHDPDFGPLSSWGTWASA